MKAIKKIVIYLLVTSLFSFNVVFAKDVLPKETNTVKYSIPKYHAVIRDYNTDLYNTILNGIKNFQTQIDVSSYYLNSEEVFDTVETVLDDHPEIFYFNTQEIRGAISQSSGLMVKVGFNYLYDTSTIINMRNNLNNKVDYIISNYIKDGMSDLQKEIVIHDYIVTNTKYGETPLNRALSFTSYGLLVEKEAVCDGYAKAMQLLLNKVGVKTIRVTGTSEEQNHAWNMVTIDGKNYYVDVTWDDPVPDRGPYTRYKYLNLSTSQLDKDHDWDKSKYPTANNEDFNYLHNLAYPVIDGDWVYYSEINDNYKIYKMKLDGTGKQKLIDDSAVGIAQYKDYLFFSNYSDGGYLYKVRKDGQDLSSLGKDFVTNIYVKDGYLNYYNNFEGVDKKISLKSMFMEEENVEEFNKRFKDYKKLSVKEDVSTNKVWNVRFNNELKDQDFKDKIYVLDSSFNKVSGISVSKDGKKAVIKSQDGYKEYKIYYIVVENIVENKDGENMKVPTVMKFTT